MSDRGPRLDPHALLGSDALWVVYHDFAGLGRAKVVPPPRFEDAVQGGVTFAKANWDIAVNDHQVPDPAYGAESGDFWAVPDPLAVFPIPYRPGVWQAEAILLDETGQPWSGDPRGRLREYLGRLEGLGVYARVAFEAEMVLATRDGEEWATAGVGRMFSVEEVEARWDWMREVLSALSSMGVAVHQFAKEYGPGQFEISLLPDDPVRAVDQFLVTRQTIRALARDRGFVASFMPKPFAELPGNGLHVHMSLVDATGNDLISGVGRSDLTPLARHAVGGLLAHASAQAALATPSPNSYKRLLPGSWAPAHMCWGLGNRAALVRIPGPGLGRRFEYRSGDATANPYLHLLGLLAAIADGVVRRLEPPDPVLVDIGHMDDAAAARLGAHRLPTSLPAALDALADDQVLLEALGPSIAEHYLAVKQFEDACYQGEAGVLAGSLEVSAWERQTYFETI